MKDMVIHNWDELQSAIFDGVWDPAIMRYRDNCVYRGMADSRWGLIPSLNRVCAHDMSLEHQMLRSFRKYGYADLKQVTSFWQMLAMAQQYGLPTRLLDWTYSPLVAAHFATEDQDAYDRDGVIWCVHIDRMNKQLPPFLAGMLQKERGNIFTMEMLDRVGDGFDALSAISSQPYALFFEPASAVNRIANQYALFSLCSDPIVPLDSLPGTEGCFRRMIIPASVKLEIRDKLDYINISERMIYPGLDGICKWIARRYAALGPKYHREPEEE
ncbi:MAG: FRG domain-containing protein [Clostridiales bacterium]|nr:FRG domain-containing protein [Clostridiales bacterium]